MADAAPEVTDRAATPSAGSDGLTVRPLGAALGGEVRGLDLSRPMSDAARDFVLRAWWDHQVLLFRDQSLSDEAILAMAEQLGGSQATGSRQYYVDAGYDTSSGLISARKAISIISNLDENGRPVKVNASTGSLPIGWHSDNSYTENPPRGSILHGLEVPIGSGMTQFASQYLAYEALSDDVKARLPGLTLRHDDSRSTAGLPRPNRVPPRSREEVTGPVHPLVRVHPDTGRPALYLGRRSEPPSSYIVELPNDESEALLDLLWGVAVRPEFQWEHEWRPGDVLMWDNRCVMHRRTAIDHRQRRVMHRTLIKGEAPIALTA